MPTGVYQHKRGYRTDKPRREAIRVIGPSIAYLPLTRGLFAIIDSEDVERLKQWSWGATTSPHDSTTYARAIERVLETGKTRSFTLHRFLMGFPDSHVDHRDGNGLHCWKGNLRLADAATNQHNSRISIRNTCGFKGVTLHPQGWQARICIRGRRRHLGFFGTAKEAGEAYDQAARELHGEFYRKDHSAHK